MKEYYINPTYIRSIELVKSEELTPNSWSITKKGIKVYDLTLSIQELESLPDYTYTGSTLILNPYAILVFSDSTQKTYHFKHDKEATDFISAIRTHSKLVYITQK